MRLIDGNKIVMSLADWWYSSFRQEETEESKAIKKVMNQVEKMVMEMPEIVRCKDCRHRDLFSCPLVDNDFQKDEDFCSWGECKEEKQVTGKLNNPDDSLLTEDSEACKEQKSKLDTDLISRQAAIEAMAPFDTNHELRDTLESLPPVEPPKKVVAQIKVDIDEIIERIKEEYKIKDRPVCEDAISRADTLKAICAECDFEDECCTDKGAFCTEYAVINDMPPVEPKRPKGECRTCKRCSDHCCETDDDFTRCPIEEHYMLPKDGYCHLYDPIWR